MAARHRLVAVLVALAGLAGVGGADAAAPPGRGWATLYLRADGCGEDAQPGRLEPRKGRDTSTGCRDLGGALINEAVHRAVDGNPYVQTRGVPYQTGPAGGVGFRLRHGEIVGQLAARTVLPAGGGVGTVTFDVVLIARASTGRYLPFEQVSVSAEITPGETITRVPLRIRVGKNGGEVVTEVRLEVARRGAGVGMDSRQLDGESWIAFPRS